MDPLPEHVAVAVIGAGQAGLSVAHYLERFGLDPKSDFVVLDREAGPGGAWRHRWDALHLGNAHRINDLPGMHEIGLSFADANRDRPARHIVAEYYAVYEGAQGFRVVRSATVRQVRDAGEYLELLIRRGGTANTVRARLVVNATGTWGSPFLPWYPGRESFGGLQVHTANYRSADDFRDKKTVVVGGGMSAVGFLFELEGVASELTWTTRRPPNFTDVDPTADNFESLRHAVELQDEAARAGLPPLLIVSGTGIPKTRRILAARERGLLDSRPMFKQLGQNGVEWIDGTFAEVDAILWATGFRPELRHLAPLRLREASGGVTVGDGASWSDPRVFFAGYGPYASTVGAGRSGRLIAREVLQRLA